jgi:hypothetical protein
VAIFGLGYGWEFQWTGGAYLRMDWLAAVGIGLCLLQRERPAAAGFLLGYAAMVRLFPVLLLVGPALVAGLSWWKGDRPRWALRLAAGFSVAIVVCFAAGSFTGRGISAWPSFVRNIELHRNTWSLNVVGLDSLVIYAPDVIVRSLGEGPQPALADRTPADILETLDDRRLPALGLKALWLILLAAAITRASPTQAALLSMGIVFALTPLSNYYWMMLTFLVLGRSNAPAFGVLLLSPILCATQLLASDYAIRYGLISVGLSILFLWWALPDAARTLRGLVPSQRTLPPQEDVG